MHFKQKKLYRTLESLASRDFDSEEELLINLLQWIVEDEQTAIKGGRIWALDPNNSAYRLVFQSGAVDKIRDNFLLPLEESPIFKVIAEERTILADETNAYLRKKGIFKYSASGIGHKKKVDGHPYYEYLLALNSENIDDELRYTLNIVATVATYQINQSRLSDSQKNLIAGIDRAKQLQRSILPEHDYKFGDFDLFGLTVPAEILGGDFFDYLRFGDGEERLGIAVGDVANKGISAAAEAFYISGALRMACTFQIKISPLMKRMNELVNKIFSDDRFTSLFYGELSTDSSGLFLFANAGHNPPIFVKKGTGKIQYLDPTGPLIGPAPVAKYDTDNINFEKGDVLVIFSDGISEAMNEKEELYEEDDKLEKIILKVADKSPREIAYAILNDVQSFSAKGIYSDDKTLVIIKKSE